MEASGSWPLQVPVQIVLLHPDAQIPKYQSDEASGMDLHANLDQPRLIKPLGRALIPCGFMIVIPPGFEGQIRPRSGLAHVSGLTILNSPGMIDADYRGEVCALLINLGPDEAIIKTGDRIAQLVFAPVIQARLEPVDKLPASERGSSGMGSTDI